MYVPGQQIVHNAESVGIFVKQLSDSQAIVRFGLDTRVVFMSALSEVG